jgi:hypothetical protein
MCGPCIKTGQSECHARVGKAHRLKTACALCNKGKKTCSDPRPQWARPIFEAMQLSECSSLLYHSLLMRIAASPSGRGMCYDVIYIIAMLTGHAISTRRRQSPPAQQAGGDAERDLCQGGHRSFSSSWLGAAPFGVAELAFHVFGQCSFGVPSTLGCGIGAATQIR